MRQWISLIAAILGRLRVLFVRPDPIQRRLNKLRAVYAHDPNAGTYSRRVKDILRGSVAPEYHTLYDRLLRIEQATADLLRKDAPAKRSIPSLQLHVQALTERVARLIEQLQRSDNVMSLYPRLSTEQAMVAEARRRLLAQIDEAMALQESVPARLLQLSTASNERDFDRMRETLADLNARLEGMAETYADLSINSHITEEKNRL